MPQNVVPDNIGRPGSRVFEPCRIPRPDLFFAQDKTVFPNLARFGIILQVKKQKIAQIPHLLEIYPENGLLAHFVAFFAKFLSHPAHCCCFVCGTLRVMQAKVEHLAIFGILGRKHLPFFGIPVEKNLILCGFKSV